MATKFAERPILRENVVNRNISDRINDTRPDDFSTDANANIKNYSVGVYDIDESLGYFFNEIIRPTVVENGEIIPVPVIYGSPERWHSMKTQGYYRDGKSKLILPLIMYRRTSIGKNENIYHLRTDELYYVTAKKWDIKNSYNKYTLLSGKDERNTAKWANNTDNYILTSLPNHVVITYEGIIWTSFVEQMNSLIEKINYKENTYWGDKNKFKFRAIIDSFDTTVELSTDTERMVRASFTMQVYGYILPEEVQGKPTSRISVSPRKITFND